jgi:uncharacterized protein YijF (DUF1287 family)
VKKIIKRELVAFCKYFLPTILVIALFMCYSCNAKTEEVRHNDNKLEYTGERGNPELSDAALSIVDGSIIYDGRYFRLDYPMGDVPKEIGVCTDVIIRAYRELGIDLQELIFTDMISNPEYYSDKPDRNISHRRVPNMYNFFEKHGESGIISQYQGKYYHPGDIVTWKIGISNHIGIVVDSIGPSGNYMVVHNIGSGQNMDDCLFDWPITGHWSYDGPNLLDKDKIKPRK